MEEQQPPKRKRKTKEQHTKDVQLAKKRKVFQNAKVIQKYRKIQEQEEDKQEKEKSNATRSSIYDQVFANTDSASTRLVGNLKGRDKKYQEKQTGRDARKKPQTTSTQRPNPYNKVVHQKNKEERLTQEQLDMKRKKRHQNAQSRKRDNKKLKRRSRRGQPVMENHVDAILAKLQAERRWRRWVDHVFPEFIGLLTEGWTHVCMGDGGGFCAVCVCCVGLA